MRFPFDYNSFSEMIREERLLNGFTQEQLAKKAGVSYNTVYLIEGKKTIPTLTVAEKLCDALGLCLSVEEPMSETNRNFEERNDDDKESREEEITLD